MSAIGMPRTLRSAAVEIARRLRPAATAAGVWVSTEAAVRLRGHLLRPAVVVASGEPPYDGIIDSGVVLVVELQSHLVDRWAPLTDITVWAPGERDVLLVRGGKRRHVPHTGTMSVRGYPTLSLPAALVCARAGDGQVVALRP